MTPSRQIGLAALLGAVLACAHINAGAQGDTRAPGSQSQNAAAAAGSSSGASGAGTNTQSGPGALTVTVPMVILVPIELRDDPKLNNGCWVRLTDKDVHANKGNDILTIVGRMSMPTLDTPSGVNWSHKADSLTVGPRATVTVYSDKDYKGSVLKLNAGQQVVDLGRHGLAHSIDSLQIDCSA